MRQRHSYSRLLITRDLFETLMSTLKVLPRFREFVLLFGAKQDESEMAPPSLRYRTLTLHNTKRRLRCHTGFGKKYCSIVCQSLLIEAECAYGLRYAELNHRDVKRPWSIRQTAVYHQYITDDKSSTWIMISLSQKTQLRIDRYIKSSPNAADLSPFELHLIILDSALANWRPFIISLTESITQQVRSITYSVVASGTYFGSSQTEYLWLLSTERIRCRHLTSKSGSA